jgi:exopolysaccharide biosynthesis predicted pyruvyltransferase EpsI
MSSERIPFTNPDDGLIGSLARTIDEVLEPLVPRDGTIALVDFPQSPNVGDSVIWLGTLAWLARTRRGAPRHVCSEFTYDRVALSKSLRGDGVILLSGGGNFGDLYENHQRLRERVISDFPGHRIVQLPQSIHFHSPEALARARRVLERHPALTLLARDRASLALARAEFRSPSHLCPDMGIELGAVTRHAPPTRPVVWLARADKEALAEEPFEPPDGVTRVDWLRDDPSAVFRVHDAISRQLRHRAALRGWLTPWLTATFERVARQRVERGARLLAQGEVVVTNRLHGHILSLLLGIPHYLVDNSYGKVRAFHETWTHDSELAHMCETQAGALRRALVATGRGPRR